MVLCPLLVQRIAMSQSPWPRRSPERGIRQIVPGNDPYRGRRGCRRGPSPRVRGTIAEGSRESSGPPSSSSPTFASFPAAHRGPQNVAMIPSPSLLLSRNRCAEPLGEFHELPSVLPREGRPRPSVWPGCDAPGRREKSSNPAARGISRTRLTSPVDSRRRASAPRTVRGEAAESRSLPRPAGSRDGGQRPPRKTGPGKHVDDRRRTRIP